MINKTEMMMSTERAQMLKTMVEMTEMDNKNRNILRRNSSLNHMHHPTALIWRLKVSLLKTADHKYALELQGLDVNLGMRVTAISRETLENPI